jgi:hypothetical protein
MDRCRCAEALDEPAASQIGLAAPEAFDLRIPVAPRNCGFESLCSIRRRSLVFQLAIPARKSSNGVQSPRPFFSKALRRRCRGVYLLWFEASAQSRAWFAQSPTLGEYLSRGGRNPLAGLNLLRFK